MKISAYFAACLLCFSCSISMAADLADSETAASRASRSRYLNDLIQPHRYTAGKNSFILQHPAKGEKKTLLELQGSGSVRHIWMTWSVGAGEDAVNMNGQLRLRVYLNGESKPALEGDMLELLQLAEKTGDRTVPMPTFLFSRTLNLYLPIYFQKGIRIEAEPTVNLGELFVQIDYRQTSEPENSLRLIKLNKPEGVILDYGSSTPPVPQEIARTRGTNSREISVRTGDQGITIPGPAILRRLTFQGEGLDDLELLMYWDDDPTPAVQSPLRYFFGGFKNAAMESEAGQLTTWFPMPFARQARLVLRGPAEREVKISYDVEEPPKLPEEVRYFHARYREEGDTVGYLPYLALQTEGAGHFVGVNLFDTGHDHGGGDTALIDPASDSPRVVHGVNGEDYFSFAWFGSGRMTPLTGAPVQERRYRLHLENPYPFNESLRFTFGVFAGNHPRSVAFWYQSPEPPKPGAWKAVDMPWNVLGPLSAGTSLPDRVDERTYETEVPSHQPIRFAATWQRAEMSHGFLDLTDHFRHFAMTREGSGFLVGKSVMQLIAYVYSDEKQEVEASWGHDDPMTVIVNRKPVAKLPGGNGFHASPSKLPLEKGWNELVVTLENENNVDWRWNGLSLAVKDGAKLRFALKPE